MSVTIRAAVALQPGCKLYYDCPTMGGSYPAQKFFDKYRGKYATFIGYSEKLVNLLDHNGRAPGRYMDPNGVHVRFDGEEKVHKDRKIIHFVILDASKARFIDNPAKDERIGDLPHPILFYPGDTVRFKKKPAVEGVTDESRKVRQIFLGEPFTQDGVPRYEVMETAVETENRLRKFHEENSKRSEENRLWSSPLDGTHGWNTAGEDIELVARGNVWALYNDIKKLSFESAETEAAFWARDGICRYVQNDVVQSALDIPKRVLTNTFGLSLEDAYRLFTTGYADVITLTYSNPGDGPRYDAKLVHECFEQHRERIRALTDQLWAHQVKQLVA